MKRIYISTVKVRQSNEKAIVRKLTNHSIKLIAFIGFYFRCCLLLFPYNIFPSIYSLNRIHWMNETYEFWWFSKVIIVSYNFTGKCFCAFESFWFWENNISYLFIKIFYYYLFLKRIYTFYGSVDQMISNRKLSFITEYMFSMKF